MKDIDKIFRDRLENHSMNPHSKIWKNIDMELEKEKNQSSKSSHSRKIRYFSVAAVAAILLMALTIGLNKKWSSKNQIQNDRIVQTEKKLSTDSQNEATNLIGSELESNGFSQEVPKSKKKNTQKNHIASQEVKILPQKTKKELYADQSEPLIQIEENIQDDPTVGLYNTSEYLVASETQSVNLENIESPSTPTVIVTEIAPIKPLIDFENDDEVQIAEVKNKSIVTRILNIVTNNIDIIGDRKLEFSNDEEGSLQLVLHKTKSIRKNK